LSDSEAEERIRGKLQGINSSYTLHLLDICSDCNGESPQLWIEMVRKTREHGKSYKYD